MVGVAALVVLNASVVVTVVVTIIAVALIVGLLWTVVVVALVVGLLLAVAIITIVAVVAVLFLCLTALLGRLCAICVPSSIGLSVVRGLCIRADAGQEQGGDEGDG